MKIVAIFLFSIVCYLTWWSVFYNQFQWLPVSFVFFINAIGLFLHKKWAAYIWFVFAVGATLYWVIRILLLVIHGWPVGGVKLTLISLFPGICFITICMVGSFLVLRDYKTKYLS
jgi:hypothetical protein